jgi:hypothetical protein
MSTTIQHGLAALCVPYSLVAKGSCLLERRAQCIIRVGAVVAKGGLAAREGRARYIIRIGAQWVVAKASWLLEIEEHHTTSLGLVRARKHQRKGLSWSTGLGRSLRGRGRVGG